VSNGQSLELGTTAIFFSDHLSTASARFKMHVPLLACGNQISEYFFKITDSVRWSNKKAIPLQAWTDPDGSRRLRLPDFKTIGT